MATVLLVSRTISWSAVTLFIINILFIVGVYVQYTIIPYLLYISLMAVGLSINFIPFYEVLQDKSPGIDIWTNMVYTIGNILYTIPPPVWLFIQNNDKYLIYPKPNNNTNVICWRYILYGCSLDYLYIRKYSLYFSRQPINDRHTFIFGMLIYLFSLFTIIQNEILTNFILVFYLPQRIALLVISLSLCGRICIKPCYNQELSEIHYDPIPLDSQLDTQLDTTLGVYNIDNPPFYDYRTL